MPKLEADSISLAFSGKSILHDVYIYLEPGIVTGLVGRNGSGKSSLLKIIFGTLRGEYQSIRIDKQYVKRLRNSIGMISYLPQNQHIPSYLTVRETMCLYNLTNKKKQLILDTFPFETNQKMGELSGGNARMLAGLCSVLSPVNFVLLDEPFSQVSPVMIEKLSNVIENEKMNKGILISDHYYRAVLDISDRLFLCRDGAVREISDKNVLYDSGYLPK